MRNKKGFTLIELLAVIVILAIIALITIPAVLKMTDNAKVSSYRRSIDLYGKSVSSAINAYKSDMIEKHQPYQVTFDNIQSYIDYEGHDVDCKVSKIYSDDTILLTECTVDGNLVQGEKGKGYGGENYYYYYTNAKKRVKVLEYAESVNKVLQGKSNIGNECTIQSDGNVTCNGQQIEVKSNLEKPISGTLTIENNTVTGYINLQFEDKKIETGEEIPQVVNGQEINNYITLIQDNNNNGQPDIGDKYSYEVSPNKIYNFYVLSIDSDKVNLIMDRNICEDGNLTDSSHLCLYPWHWQTKEWDDNNNNYGPDIAMTRLYNATKSWINVPDMIMNYIDENNQNSTEYGYTSIVTDKNTKVTTISGKQNKRSSFQAFGTNENPLKARMPEKGEVMSSEVGCGFQNSKTCPSWLVEYLELNSNDYPNTESINGIYGYWLLSSNSENIYFANALYNYGSVSDRNIASVDAIGIRPVITVPKSYLQNN